MLECAGAAQMGGQQGCGPALPHARKQPYVWFAYIARLMSLCLLHTVGPTDMVSGEIAPVGGEETLEAIADAAREEAAAGAAGAAGAPCVPQNGSTFEGGCADQGPSVGDRR